MMNGNKVLKAGLGYTIGNILIRGIGFFSIPIFTRLMSTEDYGLYNTYAAYEAIVYLVVGLALNSSVKSAKLEFEDKFDEYMSSIVVLVLFSTIGWLIIANLIYPILSASIWEYDRTLLSILVLHSGASALLVIYNAAVSVRFQYKRYLQLALLNSIGGVVLSILLIRFVFVNQTYMGRIAGVVITLAVTSVLILKYFFDRSKPTAIKNYYSFALSYSLPVIPHGIAQVLLAQFDRIMIKSIVGASAAGIYSFTGNISSIMKVISSSIETAWSPWFFEEYSKGNKKRIVDITHILIMGFAYFTSGVMLCMPEVLKIMAPVSYWDGIRLVVPMALDVFCTFLYTIYVQVEYFYKKTQYLMIGTVLAAVINVILNSLMIPKYGYAIAAYTTLFSYICYLCFHYFISKRIAGGDVMCLKKNIFQISICILVGVYASVFDNNWIVRWGLAMILSCGYLIVLVPNIIKIRK